MSTTVRVKPSRKNGIHLPPPVPMSFFDVVMPPMFAPISLIFRPSVITPTSNQFTALNVISAFADTLEYFPTFAGSIRPDQSGKLCIYSDARGADFIYEFRNESFPGEQADGITPRGMFRDPSDKDVTLVAAKLTSFSCGSHTLIVSFDHQLTDLASAMDFIRAFGSLAIGQTPTTVPKFWSRNPSEYFPDVPALSEAVGFTILPPGHPVSPPPFPAPAEQVTFRVPSQALAELKSSLGLSVSSFQLLIALLWRASAKFCSPEVGDDEILSIVIAANGRERSLNKIMSNTHYSGNFILDVTVRLKKSEILSSDGVSVVAKAIKAALAEQLTIEYIAGKVKLLQSLPADRLVPIMASKLSSWPKSLLDTEDLHFGLVKPGQGAVKISVGHDIPFPVGCLHIMSDSEEVYRTQISAPIGRGEELRSYEELKRLAISDN